jgi:hypothetical protein
MGRVLLPLSHRPWDGDRGHWARRTPALNADPRCLGVFPHSTAAVAVPWSEQAPAVGEGTDRRPDDDRHPHPLVAPRQIDADA